jgi:hypothetical protein
MDIPNKAPSLSPSLPLLLVRSIPIACRSVCVVYQRSMRGYTYGICGGVYTTCVAYNEMKPFLESAAKRASYMLSLSLSLSLSLPLSLSLSHSQHTHSLTHTLYFLWWVDAWPRPGRRIMNEA